MNFDLRAQEPDLICTCSNLYRQDIQAAIDCGCEDVGEVMYDQLTQFRCGVCRPIIQRMLEKTKNS